MHNVWGKTRVYQPYSCECSNLAQTEYKRRHDNVARIIHWERLKKNNLPHASKWYEHVPERVVESHEGKLLWDFTIQTDHVTEHRRPDIVFLDKQQGQCHAMDIVVPGDAHIEEKEKEKLEKYQDLRGTHVVAGALGIVTKNLQRSPQQIGVAVRTDFLQKAALLGTARILQKFLRPAATGGILLSIE